MNINSKITRALIVAVLLLAGIMAYAASTGQLYILPQKIFGAAALPFQKISASVSGFIDVRTDKTLNINSIVEENRQLKEELNRLREKQVEYDKLRRENREYKRLLGISDKVRRYDTVGAAVIGRDGMDKFYSFTIDRGSDRGIQVNDAVISADGLVGVVVETAPGFSKVSTILSPSVDVGCFAGSERDVGILSGNYDLSNSDLCMLAYLPKDTKLARGDLVSTSGYGNVFPADIIVGTVESVGPDTTGNAAQAQVKPAADIDNVKIVFVITNYS